MIDLVKENWPSKIFETTIGSSIKIGGETALPFLTQEGSIPNKPIIAFEAWDMPPQDFPKDLVKPYGDSLTNPISWAKKCIEEYGANLICLKLQSTHPDILNRGIKETNKFLEEFLKTINVPLIIQGCGNKEKDNLILPECCAIARDKNFLIGQAYQDNYKILTKACLDNGHSIIAESPIDINIAKQLNILINDSGLPLERIVINPTVGALGYGLEYAYSIMERARLAALSGDSMLAQSFICFVGQEAWRAKEAKAPSTPEWGSQEKRGIIWETTTAISFLQSGANILVMRHPEAIKIVDDYINEMLK